MGGLMALVAGPLFGSAARGVFGNALAFKSRGGGSVICKRPRPRVFVSLEVLGQNAWFKQACDDWSGLSSRVKADFSARAPVNLSGFQFYLSSAAASNVSSVFSAAAGSDWFPNYFSENIGLLGSMCYLLPGFSSGSIILLPFLLFGVVRVQRVSFDFMAVVSAGCSVSFFFGVSTSLFSCPDVADFIPVSQFSLDAAFPVGSSVSGLVLWVRCVLSQSI